MFVSNVVRWNAPSRPRSDDFIDNIRGAGGVFGQRLAVARAKLVQPPADSAEAARVDALDAEAHLVIADDVRAELEHRSAARNAEGHVG
jgi:hypothetical protein